MTRIKPHKSHFHVVVFVGFRVLLIIFVLHRMEEVWEGHNYSDILEAIFGSANSTSDQFNITGLAQQGTNSSEGDVAFGTNPSLIQVRVGTVSQV